MYIEIGIYNAHSKSPILSEDVNSQWSTFRSLLIDSAKEEVGYRIHIYQRSTVALRGDLPNPQTEVGTQTKK